MKKRMKRMKTSLATTDTMNFLKKITLINVYVIKMCVCSWENLVPKYGKFCKQSVVYML